MNAWLHRARWRWRGAWMWPVFAVTVVLDGAIAVSRPFVGDRQSFYGGLLAGMICNLLAVVLLSRALGMLLRRRRTDMPAEVARNYGGTFAILGVTVILLTAGLAGHGQIINRQNAFRDAVVRADAYIGDHAPDQFRVNALRTNTFTIQAGALYRTCAPGRDTARWWCVIVHSRRPLAQSVVPAGGESNALFSEGVN